jgi:hypothetical protein
VPIFRGAVPQNACRVNRPNVIKIYIQISDYRLQTIVYSKINVEIKIKL